MTQGESSAVDGSARGGTWWPRWRRIPRMRVGRQGRVAVLV